MAHPTPAGRERLYLRGSFISRPDLRANDQNQSVTNQTRMADTNRVMSNPPPSRNQLKAKDTVTEPAIKVNTTAATINAMWMKLREAEGEKVSPQLGHESAVSLI